MVTKRRHIVVVDDDGAHCSATLLGEIGHEVTFAASDKEAYGVLQRETIDALVVDINLGRGRPDSMWRA